MQLHLRTVQPHGHYQSRTISSTAKYQSPWPECVRVWPEISADLAGVPFWGIVLVGSLPISLWWVGRGVERGELGKTSLTITKTNLLPCSNFKL